MVQPSPTLASPAQLLAMLQQNGSGGGEPPLEELMESVQRVQAGAAPAAAGLLEVFPEPGFVIKTANEQGQKVFINVCGSSKAPLPAGWTKGQVPSKVSQYLERGQGGDAPPAMQLQPSMGPPRLDSDHTGEACLVLDCIFSSELLARCADYRPLKMFLIQLALGKAEQQNGLQLNPQYKLPKMRYKGGTPPPQVIRLEGGGSSSTTAQHVEQQHEPPGSISGSSGGGGKQLIAEVPLEGGSEEPPAFALLANKRQQRQHQHQQPRPSAGSARAAEQQHAAPPPAAQLQQQRLQPQIEYSGKPASAVTITLPLPAAVAAAVRRAPASARAAVCAETVRVQVPGCQPLEVQLPFAVSAAGGCAEVAPAAKGGDSLVLTLPYRPFSSVLEELRQAAVAADGQRLGDGSAPVAGSDLSELD